MGTAGPPEGGGRAAAVYCSICLDAVIAGGGGGGGGNRSTASLQCGHQFHLDCIGSAFNAKGLMQCPNCRKVEKGSWLFSNGCRSLPEISVEALMHDNDIYDISYSEMPLDLHWCPFNRVAQIYSSFGVGESTPALTVQELVVHRGYVSDHISPSATVHECPYLAYFYPLHSSYGSAPSVSSENPMEGVYHRWSHIPALDARTYDLHSNGLEHPSFQHFAPSTNTGGPEQNSTTNWDLRLASDSLHRSNDLGNPFIHERRANGHGNPFILGQRSRSSAGGSFSPFPPYAHNPRSQAHIVNHQGYPNTLRTHAHGHMFSGAARRSGNTRSLGPVRRPLPSPHDNTAYNVFPQGHSSGDIQGLGTRRWNHFSSFEGDHFTSYPPPHTDVEPTWWYPTGRVESRGRPDGPSSRPSHRSRNFI